MDVPFTAAWIGVDQVHSMAGDDPFGPTGTRTLCPSRGVGVVLRQAGAPGSDGARPP
jgi:hypothetical protein